VTICWRGDLFMHHRRRVRRSSPPPLFEHHTQPQEGRWRQNGPRQQRDHDDVARCHGFSGWQLAPYFLLLGLAARIGFIPTTLPALARGG
jgi:hypothetical protein